MTAAPAGAEGAAGPAPGGPAAAARHPGRGLIRSLVGIRALLATLVLLVHLAPYAIGLIPVSAPVWAALWTEAKVALDVFFVLSGFVITAGYRTVFDHWPGPGTYGRFLWARLQRFYPLHLAVLVTLVLALAVAPLLGVEIPHHGGLGTDLLRQVTLTQGWGWLPSLTWNGPTWSLSAEWFSYLLVPLILPLVLRVRSPRTAVVGYLLAMAVPLTAYSLLGFDDAHITSLAPLWRSGGEFVAGALLCQLQYTDSGLPARVGRLTGAIATVTLLTVAGTGAAGLSPLWAAPLAGLLVLGLAQQHGGLNRVLASRPIVRGGDLSVSLYLTHVPWLLAATIVITPARFPGGWGWLGVGLLVTGAFVVAWVGYAAVELPAQRWMRRTVRPAHSPQGLDDARPRREVGDAPGRPSPHQADAARRPPAARSRRREPLPALVRLFHPWQRRRTPPAGAPP